MCLFCDMGDLGASDAADFDPNLAAAAAEERQRLWDKLMQELAAAEAAGEGLVGDTRDE